MLPERQYHANGRAGAVAGRERSAMPGTPSRKDKHRESSALQDPGLKDYVCTPPTYRTDSLSTKVLAYIVPAAGDLLWVRYCRSADVRFFFGGGIALG